MARHPAAATWMPLLALVLTAGLAAYLTREAPERPGARLLAAVQGFCRAISDGELDAAMTHLTPHTRTALNAARVARALEDRRGASWLVVDVDPDLGTTAVVWGPATTDRPQPQEVLRWASQPDGSWKVVL